MKRQKLSLNKRYVCWACVLMVCAVAFNAYAAQDSTQQYTPQSPLNKMEYAPVTSAYKPMAEIYDVTQLQSAFLSLQKDPLNQDARDMLSQSLADKTAILFFEENLLAGEMQAILKGAKPVNQEFIGSLVKVIDLAAGAVSYKSSKFLDAVKVYCTRESLKNDISHVQAKIAFYGRGKAGAIEAIQSNARASEYNP